jgi:hypothetical protein
MTTLSKPGWADAVIAEYAAHRAEVLSEAEAQQQTLAFGMTAVGIVVAGAFNVWGNTLLASVAFLGAVPLLNLVILVQWVGRARGLMRVGVYLERLEDALRAAYPLAPQSVFIWEKTRARDRRDKWWRPSYEWHDYGAIAIFALLAYGSIALGGYHAYADHAGIVVVVVVFEVSVLSLIAAALIYEMATIRARVRRLVSS